MNKIKLLSFILFLFIANISFGQQSKTIKGVVTFASDGTAVPGATVVVKGTALGTISDYVDGSYEIEVDEDARFLVFSFIGYKNVEKEIGDNSTIDVQLEEDVFGLEEVVVSGVASAMPKKNLTISVEKVDAGSMKAAHASSAINALQGKVAGLQITVANGLPGSGATVRLRGSTSLIGDNDPLIILDGVRIETKLADINLDDIESYEVVKGASAAALYGSEAGNGAIVLISKRGKDLQEGKSTVTIRSEYGYQELDKFLEVATHHPYQLADNWEEYDYTRYANIFYYEGVPISGNRQLTETGYADQPFKNVYNHQDLLFRKGNYHTEYIGITGHGHKSNYLLSFENNNQGGIISFVDGYQRNNIKFNMDRYVGDKISISTSNLLMRAVSDQPSDNKAFKDILFISPDVDLLAKNSDSSDYLIDPDIWKVGLVENPLYPLANKDRLSKRISVIGNLKLNYYITDWMKAEAKYTYEYRGKQWTTIRPKGYLANAGKYILGTLYKKDFTELNQDLQFILNLNKQFKDFTSRVKLSYLYESSENEFLKTYAKEFTIIGIPHFNNVDPTTASLLSRQEKIVTIDYFGIVDLDYKNKYIFSSLYRMDGSSLFGSEVRWNPYFRFSGGYRLTEDFNLPYINELKIRVAYGSSGQRPRYYYRFEELPLSDGAVNIRGAVKANKFLKPSTTKELEFGLNMDFLNRFSLSVVYAITNTDNAFKKAPLASHTGFAYQYQNVGSLSGTSFEMSLNSRIINTKIFSWTADLSFDKITQKIDKLDIPAYFDGPKNAYYVASGEEFGAIYGSSWVTSLEQMANQLPEDKTIDDYEINSEGYVIPKGTEGTPDEIPINLDQDNDGNVDKIKIGSSNPKFRLSMNNSLNFKGLSLGFLLSWKNGGDVYNFTRQYGYRDLAAKDIDQYGKPENEKKSINYYSTLYKATEVNSHFVEDGSYLKLREVSLSYSLDDKSLGNLSKFIKSVKIGLQARNVLTFTKYTGYDPEVASGSDLSNYDFDNFGYPNFRTYSGSIKMTF